MVDLDNIEIPSAYDPFAEAKDTDAPGAKEYVHIRVQQRNGKKCLTTIQGLKKDFSLEKILKDVKKRFLLQRECGARQRARQSYSASRRSTQECVSVPNQCWYCEKGSY